MSIACRASYLRKGLSQRIYKIDVSIWGMIGETDLKDCLHGGLFLRERAIGPGITKAFQIDTRDLSDVSEPARSGPR
jgi:hypothetical protein